MERPTYRQILGRALRRAPSRWLALLTGAAYLLLYLWSLGHLVVDRDVVAPGGTPGFVVVPDWTARIFQRIAGVAFEPVAAVYPVAGLAIFLAPANLLIGSVLSFLIALNVVTAADAITTVRSCRRLPWAGLLGSLPGLLTGLACCVPTVALALGANLTLALISVQPFVLPVSLAGLMLGLGWNLHRTRTELLRLEGW